MIEEQVDEIILPTDFNTVLAADECEALAELEYQRAQMFDQATLQVPFQHTRSQCKEVEGVRIFDELLG